MQNVLEHASGWRLREPALYRMLSPDLKRDLDLIVAARSSNCFDVSDLPKALLQDPEFWKDALSKTCMFWRDMPDGFKNEIVFARCINGFNEDPGLLEELVALHPSLASDADFWCTSILSKDSDFYGDDLVELINEIGTAMRSNRAVMLQACSKASDLLPQLPSTSMASWSA